MRRILLTATSVTALVLAAPGAALAHHRHHHKRGTHHAQVSFRHLGPIAVHPAGPPATPASGSTPATPNTTTPTTTTPTTEENAGKVTSYTGGTLTVTLGDGSKVSGKVTVDTRFQCISATAMQPPGDEDDEQGPGDDNGWGDDQGASDRNQQGGPPWQDGQGPQGAGQWQHGGDGENGPGDDQDDDEAPISTEPPCDSSALVENAVVRAAELRIAPGGAEFEWIVLVR